MGTFKITPPKMESRESRCYISEMSNGRHQIAEIIVWYVLQKKYMLAFNDLMNELTLKRAL